MASDQGQSDGVASKSGVISSCCIGVPLAARYRAFSGDEHGCEKCLTESPRVRYAQKQGKRVFFGNVTTALSLSSLVGCDK